MSAVAIGFSGDQPLIGDPVTLFQGDFDTYAPGGASYSIDPEGERFLMLKFPDTGPPISFLRLVMNWPEELKSLAPRG